MRQEAGGERHQGRGERQKARGKKIEEGLDAAVAEAAVGPVGII
jgi:hypothetical protein